MSTSAESPAQPPLITPAWFKQRQLKAEAVGANEYRLTGPNMAEALLGLRRGETGRYTAYLRRAEAGPDVAVSDADFATAYDAWEAAFELYRQALII